jgi:hypothetical protein
MNEKKYRCREEAAAGLYINNVSIEYIKLIVV